jgi:carboxymethylenebutenolidase
VEEHFSVPDAQAFAADQRGKGREAEVVVYAGAGHGFFNDSRPDVFHQASANDAWRRTLALFSRVLR